MATGPTHVKDLVPDPENRRTHNPRNLGMVVDALHQVGAARSIVIDEDNVILAGNGVTEAAAEAGITKVRVIEADGHELIAVRRKGLSKAQKRALAIYDNRTAELAEWNAEQLQADLANGLSLEPWFSKEEQAAILRKAEPVAGLTDPDAVPVERATDIKRGDLFELGKHRLLCGDSTNQAEVQRVLHGDDADLLLTDPPYCSGGFQEAGKASGSIGTRSDEMIHNDTLSTRGYIALMKAVVSVVQAKAAYVFTDWRMWINLFDVMESSGYGVRNMIVWDKQSPGMGQGWRMQHELVMTAITSRAPKFDPHVAQGNVIQANRTGNVLHPTQKPVDLLEKILRVSNWATVIVDPFAGSGTTLMSTETVGLSCRAVELSPRFCQVIIDRWEQFTGQKAVKVGEAVSA
jgi:DNA modification methylase